MATKRQGKQITIHQSVKRYFLWCQSVSMSKNTITDYANTFDLFMEYIGQDMLMNDVTPDHVEAFLREMANRPVNACQGATAMYATEKTERKRSAKTLRNYHIGLSSLWTWAVEHGFADEHIVRSVRPPKYTRKPVIPLSDEEMARLIKACDHPRDKAIIGLMMETGLRAQEVANLRVRDITWDSTGGRVYVRAGKGDKDRLIPFRKRCALYLQQWLIERDIDDDNDPLFCNYARNAGLPMTRQTINKQINRIGKSAGVNAHAHRLRTTALCAMVRNGMEAFHVRDMAGHEEIETTLRYVRAADIDLSKAMKKSSPLDNLRL